MQKRLGHWRYPTLRIHYGLEQSIEWVAFKSNISRISMPPNIINTKRHAFSPSHTMHLREKALHKLCFFRHNIIARRTGYCCCCCSDLYLFHHACSLVLPFDHLHRHRRCRLLVLRLSHHLLLLMRQWLIGWKGQSECGLCWRGKRLLGRPECGCCY